MNFTNLMFAKGADDRKRRWDSESMRVALKKQFLDRLSSVICHHRVRDFIYLGIPNRRLVLAQVQAQMPAFLAEAHADAVAQAQGQEAQVQVQAAQAQVGEPAPAQAQVGEVSDVNRNVNIVNSPVVS